MGADLIVATVAMRKDINPDWEKARTFISEADPDKLRRAYAYYQQYDSIDEVGTADEIRAEARSALSDLEDAWEYGSRDFAMVYIADLQILITGEMSYGDSPAGVTVIETARAVGTLHAAGFIGELSLDELADDNEEEVA